MSEIRLGLRDALDRVPLGHLAIPKPGERRKDVPHPTRLLLAAPDLAERLLVVTECLLGVTRLRLHEAVQVVRVGRATRFARVCHKPTSCSRTLGAAAQNE